MMSAFDNPKKKKISSKRLDAAVNSFVTENSFSIEIPDPSGKPIVIDFKRFMSPIQLGGLLRQASSTSIIRDVESGGMLFDAPSLELSIHNYILTALSTFETPSVLDEDGDSLDVIALGIYGTYFRSISEDYDNMFTALYVECKKVIDAKLVNYARMMESVLDSFNVSDMMKQNELTSAFVDAIKEIADKVDNTVVPLTTPSE